MAIILADKIISDGGRIIAEFDLEPETPDFDALFPEPKRQRHSWGPQKFSGSFVQHERVSLCACGISRHRQYDYGHHRTIFKDKDGFPHERTPVCTRTTNSERG